MTAIVRGLFRQGELESLEVPNGLPEGHVRVILVAPDPSGLMCPLTFGKYQGKASTLDNFRDAEWHGFYTAG